MIITIDGLVATGKSTVAKQLAKELGFIYFDTGAMYRCLTYAILKHQIDLNDTLSLQNLLDLFSFDIKIKQGERVYLVEGEDVTLKIRRKEITALVSKVSAIAEVREKLVALQKQLSEGVNAIFEGRDMGTVVFPKAQLKIFLIGKEEVRAQRRFNELMAKFPEEKDSLTLEKVLAEIKERDESDSNRAISPLKQAEDAVIIDTSELSVEEVVSKIIEIRSMLKTRK